MKTNVETQMETIRDLCKDVKNLTSRLGMICTIKRNTREESNEQLKMSTMRLYENYDH